MLAVRAVEKSNMIECRVETEDGGQAPEGKSGDGKQGESKQGGGAQRPEVVMEVDMAVYDMDTKRGKIMALMIVFTTSSVTAYAIVFSKLIGETIKSQASGEPEFLTPWPYLFIAGLVGCTVTQVKFLNKSLACFPILIIVPAGQVVNLILQVTTGLVYFEEYKTFTLVLSCIFK